MVRRLAHYRELFGEDDPSVYILAPSAERPVPAGDTRRGTAWIFRTEAQARAFAGWVERRHQLDTVPVRVRLREVADALSAKDVTWVLDPEPKASPVTGQAFKAPLSH